MVLQNTIISIFLSMPSYRRVQSLHSCNFKVPSKAFFSHSFMYFLKEAVTKIVQRSFSANTWPFLFLWSSYLYPTACRLQLGHTGTVFSKRSVSTPWNNSWIITNCFKTIILSVIWLLPKWIAYTVQNIPLFRYQILCLPILPCHFIILKNLYCYLSSTFPKHLLSDLCGTWRSSRSTDSWNTWLLAIIPIPFLLSQFVKHGKILCRVFTFSSQTTFCIASEHLNNS